MGRTEKSQGLAPPAIRKDIRAKQARHIVTRVIPAILASNARARRGAEGSELIVDPGPVVAPVKDNVMHEVHGGDDTAYIKRKGQGRRKAKSDGVKDGDILVRYGHDTKGKSTRKANSLDEAVSNLRITSTPPPPSPKGNRTIRIITTDTLTAAHMLTFPSQYGVMGAKQSRKTPNVCILNMASPLRPGGGVLTGATSQEEFLCARTTLLPSLKESFYRLPELGGIWTSDVLVFRSHLPLGDSKGELRPGERYWLDAISAGMHRFPELEGEADEAKRLGKKDAESVEAKMRAVLRIVARKGVKKLVLGAWGCGAYANPVPDIAKAWRKVLEGRTNLTSKRANVAAETETWPDLEAVIFAISHRKMAIDFAQAFGDGIEIEAGPQDAMEEEQDEGDKEVEELRTKIQDMEGQLSRVWNPDLKSRIGVILEGLEAQLQEQRREAGTDACDEGRNKGHTIATMSEDEQSSASDEQGTSDSSSEEDVQGDDNEDGIGGDEVKGS